ncbi:hypothetical protein N7462_010168 [Penicillium macrosclerotiorum]|uniref:uncharacterized protein n=1 Tax=Penicillium macrosclerotiorum TaxID=303699 RepID=UPI0025484E94|nr:uncharacterized protein N7462_010168 [Penicillium macrosclerotiorum]KAJ5669098.1 hypothetical protein N7462_010168 [Penicillium macrosclerotiorum]
MRNSNNKPKYRLSVTAGTDYKKGAHEVVQVNGKTLRFDSDLAVIDLNVRIQDYTGYPDSSPSTSPYFENALHKNDKYSISFSFTSKHNINGNNLVFGNDFDNPLRDRLPMGFNAALSMVKWTLDPSIEGDAYADKPYLYSPALATWNQFRIGEKNQDLKNSQLMEKSHVVEEGAEGQGEESRRHSRIPGTATERRKHFRNEENRKLFQFEAGRTYLADFGNQYLSFSDLSVRLPGFHIPVFNMVDDDHRELRYVLKDSRTGTVYLVVLFSLVKCDLDGEEEQE